MGKRFIKNFIGIILCSIFMIGCGGGGTSEPEVIQPPPPPSNNWDSMQWDQGSWHN